MVHKRDALTITELALQGKGYSPPVVYSSLPVLSERLFWTIVWYWWAVIFLLIQRKHLLYIGRLVLKPRVSMGANPDFKDLDSRPLWCVFSSN